MTNERILLAGAVLLLAVVAAVATQRLRLPLLITFLGLGRLLGSEGSAASSSTAPSSRAATGYVLSRSDARDDVERVIEGWVGRSARRPPPAADALPGEAR